jgi:hypothetical protein
MDTLATSEPTRISRLGAESILAALRLRHVLRKLSVVEKIFFPIGD